MVALDSIGEWLMARAKWDVGAEEMMNGLFVVGLLITFNLVVVDFRSLRRLFYAIFNVFRVRYVYWKHRNGSIDDAHEEASKILGNMLLQLGGVWAKSGQFTALRGDLIPRAFQREFSKCQDSLPPRPFKEVRKSIEKELGCDIYEVFEWVDEKCLSCATIAQVHRARLKGDAREVVIKIQHPKVGFEITRDLRVVKTVRFLVEFLFPHLHTIKLLSLYLRLTRRELNFLREVKNMLRIKASVNQHSTLRQGFVTGFSRPMREWDTQVTKGTEVLIAFDQNDPNTSFLPGNIISRIDGTDDFRVAYTHSPWDMKRNIDHIMLRGDEVFLDVIIPTPMTDLCTEKLIVMSFEQGRVTKKADFIGQAQEHLMNQTSMIARAFAHMIFVDLFAHGDPHPANILYTDSDVPVILDFGLCMELREEVVRGWCKVIYGSSHFHFETMYEGFDDLGFCYRPDVPGADKQEQMMNLVRLMAPGLANSQRTELSALDRSTIVDLMFKHNIASDDLLFILRISNYIANLGTSLDLRATNSAYPAFAEKAVKLHGWINKSEE